MNEALLTLQNRLRTHKESVAKQRQDLLKVEQERSALVAEIERSERIKTELEAGIRALGGTVE